MLWLSSVTISSVSHKPHNLLSIKTSCLHSPAHAITTTTMCIHHHPTLRLRAAKHVTRCHVLPHPFTVTGSSIVNKCSGGITTSCVHGIPEPPAVGSVHATVANVCMCVAPVVHFPVYTARTPRRSLLASTSWKEENIILRTEQLEMTERQKIRQYTDRGMEKKAAESI